MHGRYICTQYIYTLILCNIRTDKSRQTDRLFHPMNNQCTNWKIYILIPCNWHANANIGYIDIKTERHQISDSLFIQCIVDAGTRWEILLLFATYTKTGRHSLADKQTDRQTDRQCQTPSQPMPFHPLNTQCCRILEESISNIYQFWSFPRRTII